MNKTIKALTFIFSSITLILILGIIFVSIWSNEQTNNPNSQTNKVLESRAADTQRKNSVGSIWGAAQEYRQKTGTYPTNATLNTPSFQTEYRLSNSTLQDPANNNPAVATTPAKGLYAYASTANDGASCNNVDKPCTKFKVTAILNDNTEYSLTESR